MSRTSPAAIKGRGSLEADPCSEFPMVAAVPEAQPKDKTDAAGSSSRGADDSSAVLVQAGADLKALTEAGLTPLQLAAGSNNNPDVIAALMESWADPKARDNFGMTPLHHAAEFRKNPAVIAELVDAGADPKARDNAGKTPWDYVKDREPIKGSDVHWRLNDAKY